MERQVRSSVPHHKGKQFRNRKGNGSRGRGFSRGRGRGNGRGRGRRHFQRKIKSDRELVPALVTVLRHEAKRFSLQVNSEGKVALSDLRRIPVFSEFEITEEKIMRLVEEDSEQVFSVKHHNDRGLMIGINDRQTITYTFQRHEKMLIENPDSPWKVCHGTYFQNLKYILSEGLSCMHREFIHLSPTDSITGAQNGLRNDYDCLIYINIEAAMNDGIVFYLTTDNVILTTGFDGFLQKDYFHKIIGFSESGIPLHQSVLWVDTNPEVLSLHEEELCIDDIPNRTFIDLINICRDGFRCERPHGDCPFFHPQPQICDYFMRNWNCFTKNCKHLHLEHCFREDSETTDQQVRDLDGMRKQKREARLIYMENKKRMMELETQQHNHNYGKPPISKERGRFTKPNGRDHQNKRTYKNNSHTHSYHKNGSFHQPKPVKRTSSESERSVSNPPRQNRSHRSPHQKPQPTTTQNNIMITQKVEAPMMVVGQVVNNHHNVPMNPPVVMADANVGWDHPNQNQFPPQGKQAVHAGGGIQGLSINTQMQRVAHSSIPMQYIAYSPISTVNNQYVVLPSYSSPVPTYSSPVPFQQKQYQYFPASYSAPPPIMQHHQAYAHSRPHHTGPPFNPVYVEEAYAGKNQYQSRVKPYAVPRNNYSTEL